MATATVTPNLTTAEKIQQAAAEAIQIAEIFAPQITPIADAGIALEPVFIGFAHMIAQLFHHHTKVPAATYSK